MVDRNIKIVSGFTLVELIIVLAVISLLITLAAPNYFRHIESTREAVLIENLKSTRRIIDTFRQDTGRYPNDLRELVDKRYLHSLPIDPFTERHDTWILVVPPRTELGSLRDIRSAAPGRNSRGVLLGDL
jgi:general secretion pathway protein G